ncbi:MAG: LytTR family DNA-binding domain-containing protein [Bacteroidota bacterium]
MKSEKKIHQVKLDEVLYLESYGSYVKIHLSEETILTLERLSNFEKKLPDSSFIRVHKSYIVPVHQIKLIEGNRITVGDVKIPIGQVYKMNVNKLIE